MKTTKDGFTEDVRIALLEQSIGHINETLISIQRDMKDGFVRIDQKFEKVDQTLIRMDQKIDSNFKWLLIVYLGGFSGLFGIIAQSLHWFK